MAKLCVRCKTNGILPMLSEESPVGSSGCIPRGKPKNAFKPVYLWTDPADKKCIVVGGVGGKNGVPISLQLPHSQKSNIFSLNCGGGLAGKSGCIKILSNSIIRASNGGLQILPGKGKNGGLQICMANGKPEWQLGVSSDGRSCDNRGGEAIISGGGRGDELQLSSVKGKGGSSSLMCSPCGSGNFEVRCVAPTRKLDMNHCKPTIAYTIHRRIVELECERRKAECPSIN